MEIQIIGHCSLITIVRSDFLFSTFEIYEYHFQTYISHCRALFVIKQSHPAISANQTRNKPSRLSKHQFLRKDVSTVFCKLRLPGEGL